MSKIDRQAKTRRRKARTREELLEAATHPCIKPTSKAKSHVFDIPHPSGTYSYGKCRKCGAIRQMRNSTPSKGFNNNPERREGGKHAFAEH